MASASQSYVSEHKKHPPQINLGNKLGHLYNLLLFIIFITKHVLQLS